jgi:hypothetical protein
MDPLDLERLYSFRIVGIDYSTRFVDFVFLDYDDGSAEWQRVDLGARGKGFNSALQAARAVRSLISWDRVEIVVIEEPAGTNHRTTFLLGMVAGQVTAVIPERITVNYMSPSVWRPLFGIPAHGPDRKRRARERAIQLGFDPGPLTPDDAYEAFALAWVMREENARAAAIGRA